MSKHAADRPHAIHSTNASGTCPVSFLSSVGARPVIAEGPPLEENQRMLLLFGRQFAHKR
ncbi:hypothetical protein LMG28614_01745 [Paraburkholderia ultramafica]|uniref:Uncharacterized protein n=1 Tax=Paraburkholderia ultramafica TaxID=1544867 RepID=A0A6S7B2Y8_9BURK|nr:hypothetical protein LMG28614_01745 [Paraburkholderia ultramafica]